MPTLFEDINNRINPNKLDTEVKNALIEGSKKNWAERNPFKFMAISNLIAAILGSVSTLLIQNLLLLK
jgi:hypothetical protein